MTKFISITTRSWDGTVVSYDESYLGAHLEELLGDSTATLNYEKDGVKLATDLNTLINVIDDDTFSSMFGKGTATNVGITNDLSNFFPTIELAEYTIGQPFELGAIIELPHPKYISNLSIGIVNMVDISNYDRIGTNPLYFIYLPDGRQPSGLDLNDPAIVMDNVLPTAICFRPILGEDLLNLGYVGYKPKCRYGVRCHITDKGGATMVDNDQYTTEDIAYFDNYQSVANTRLLISRHTGITSTPGTSIQLYGETMNSGICRYGVYTLGTLTRIAEYFPVVSGSVTYSTLPAPDDGFYDAVSNTYHTHPAVGFSTEVQLIPG